MKSFDQIENVLIFVSDSLRWDHLPDQIASKGVVFKTVAQGCKTAISFPTLATGLRPQQHGVSSWGHQIPEDVFSIFRSDSLNTGFHNSGRSFSGLCPVVGADKEAELSELDPPFLCLERDNNPHLPHAGFESQEEYFRDRGNDLVLMREDYENVVEQSRQLFEHRLKELEERDLLDETLVIFTSDHGELLGEYGELDHGAPLCPELAYVPTVFVHPELTADDFYVDPNTEIIEHVDIISTALSAISHDIRGMAGTDILSEERSISFGYCYSEERDRDISLYEANGIWWYDGGYVFTANSRTERLVYTVAHAYKSNRRRYLRRNLWSALRNYVPEDQVYGDPPVEKLRARELLTEMLERIPEHETSTVSLNDDARKTLKDLGYLQ